MMETSCPSQLTVAVGMGPVVAFRYFKNLYLPSAINILQQIEQSNGSIQTSGNLESARANLTNLLTGSRKIRDSNYHPLLSDSAESAR
jgi:phospholipid-translocating ATPase